MNAKADKKLKLLRKKIDQADRQIIQALGARFKTVKNIGIFKIKEGMPILQKTRWKAVMAERLKLAQKSGVDKKLLESLYTLIHTEALRIQKKLIRK